MMTAAQKFLALDPDTLTPAELAGAAEAARLDLIPCEFCSAWVPRQHEWDYYRCGRIEVCEMCLRQIDSGTQPCQMSGKGEEPLPTGQRFPAVISDDLDAH